MTDPPLAARRRFQRSDERGVRPVTFGPWHVRKPDTWTLCGQRLSAAIDSPGLDARALTDVPPLDGRLCVRCWDRHSGKTQELQAARRRVRALAHKTPLGDDPS